MRLRTSLLGLAAFVAAGVGVLDLGVTGTVWAQDKVAEKEAASDKDEQEKPEELVDLTLGEGRLELKVPKAWKKNEPKFNLIEAEFAPAESVKEDDKDAEPQTARLTMMASGGSIEQNIERWQGQFSQEDDSSTNDHTKTKKTKINGMTVHIVSITGTYDDRPGPFAPNGTPRPGYRMLSAIVETGVAGNYYLKMYGPKKAVDDNEKRFHRMLESMRISL